MASEIHWIAALMGQASASGRLDPPLLMGLVISSSTACRHGSSGSSSAAAASYPSAAATSGRGADHPAEPGHRGRSPAARRRSPRRLRRRPAPGPCSTPRRPVAPRRPPMRTSCSSAAILECRAGVRRQAKSETGLVLDETFVDHRQPAQRLLESHRLAHTASARRRAAIPPRAGTRAILPDGMKRRILAAIDAAESGTEMISRPIAAGCTGARLATKSPLVADVPPARSGGWWAHDRPL